MSFYDADDFDEEFVDDEDEDTNAFEVTMSAVFDGHGDDAEAALALARTLAEESIYDGDWELDDGKVITEAGAGGYMQFEFTALSVIEADSMEEAIDVAVSELSEDWDLSGEPTPVYLDD